ncbi:GL18012 [Drosophila persimilis]|uniref:GL18012 n=1 Tax=Drosophila persimilis TaxID=7234 RepID=B4H258_DROPE|nr:GL18012 [Drosophila persimilis]
MPQMFLRLFNTRDNTSIFSEYIEHLLRNVDMRVAVVPSNEDVMLFQVLANISSCGITVNMLFGFQAEHRQEPFADGVNPIATDFRLKARGSFDAPDCKQKLQLDRPAGLAKGKAEEGASLTQRRCPIQRKTCGDPNWRKAYGVP